MSNRFVIATAFENATLEEAYKSRELNHSNPQQANKIALMQIKDEKALQEPEEEATDCGEKEHLLSGQMQQQQQQQQQLTEPSAGFKLQQLGNAGVAATAAGEKMATNLNANVRDANGEYVVKAKEDDYSAAEALQSERKSDKMTQYNNTGNNSGAGIPGRYTNLQQNIQKFPEESQHNNEQNGTTIILTPTSLNTTTMPSTNVQKPMATRAGHGGVSRGGSRNGSFRSNAANTGCDIQHNEYKGPKHWLYLVRNWTDISEPLCLLIIFLMLWGLGYVLLPEYAVPSTGIMRIAFLFIGAQAMGILVTFIHLPDMLGMLFFGVFYANVGLADFTGYQPFEAFLREMALINIMLLAGLGLDGGAFRRLWLMIMRLTLIPTIAEVIIIAVLAFFLLDMPWLWGILLGLVITAVSPNVVVTVMLKLKEERLGLNNGIHTLIYAMTACNDVVAVFLFGIIVSVIFSTGSLSEQILQGPIGIGIGLVFGYLMGNALQFLPSRKSNYTNGLRFVMTILAGTIAVMGSKAIGYPSAGALGCVMVAFVAGIGWKREQEKFEHQQNANVNFSVPKCLDLLWKFLKPVSFSLIGKEINFAVLDGRVVGYGVLLILLGSLFRLGFAYISTYGGNLTMKERAYITISGFPKATVQAALGPIALDLARSSNVDEKNLSLASNVLIISVLAIIFTAPLGAILMLRLAPLWLQRSIAETNNGNHSNGLGHADTMIDSTKLTRNSSNNSNKSQNVGGVGAFSPTDSNDAQTAAATGITAGGPSTKAAHHMV